MAQAIADSVLVGEKSNGLWSYCGAMQCGYLTCVNCAPIIAKTRRSEIVRAIDSYTRGHGGRVSMATFTLRHDRSQRHKQLADAVAVAWDRVISGKAWGKDRKAHGIVGYIKVMETVYNDDNGWHVHIHVLLFHAASLAFPTELLRSMFARWRMSAIAQGLAAPIFEKGFEIHEVTDAEGAADALGAYLTKDSLSAPESLGYEMSSYGTKTRTVDGRAQSFEPSFLLQVAAAGDEKSRALYQEFELSMHKRRSITWARGLRELLGLDIELTDEEVVELEDIQALIPRLKLPGRLFRHIARVSGARGELLAIGREHGAYAVELWLRARGYLEGEESVIV